MQGFDHISTPAACCSGITNAAHLLALAMSWSVASTGDALRWPHTQAHYPGQQVNCATWGAAQHGRKGVAAGWWWQPLCWLPSALAPCSVAGVAPAPSGSAGRAGWPHLQPTAETVRVAAGMPAVRRGVSPVPLCAALRCWGSSAGTQCAPPDTAVSMSTQRAPLCAHLSNTMVPAARHGILPQATASMVAWTSSHAGCQCAVSPGASVTGAAALWCHR